MTIKTLSITIDKDGFFEFVILCIGPSDLDQERHALFGISFANSFIPNILELFWIRIIDRR